MPKYAGYDPVVARLFIGRDRRPDLGEFFYENVVRPDPKGKRAFTLKKAKKLLAETTPREEH